MKILVTGAAGFIGSFTALRFLGRGEEVVGLDNLNDYYDVTLKSARLQRLQQQPRFSLRAPGSGGPGADRRSYSAEKNSIA